MKTRRSTPKSLRNPRQDRSRATVDAILEAAARILEREGPEGLCTNRIARDAGVSIGSLYEYFDGRDAIVRTLCERHLDVVRAVTDQAFELLEHAPLVDRQALGTEHALELGRCAPARLGQKHGQRWCVVRTGIALLGRHAWILGARPRPGHLLADDRFAGTRCASCQDPCCGAW